MRRPPRGVTLADMKVVERGLARCPRCVAIADYSFVECGPNSIRYEVKCQRCGEAYSEESYTVPTRLGAQLEKFTDPPTPNGAVDKVPSRLAADLRQWWASTAAVRYRLTRH